MAASTPILASEPDGRRPEHAAGRTTRFGLLGLSVVLLMAFSIYAAYLASRADEVGDSVPISVPGNGGGNGGGGALAAGQRAADFALTTLDGNTVRLSDYAGRPVWINVWASWCAPCRAEMPDIQTVYDEINGGREQAGGNGLALLVISLGEDPAVVRQYLDSTGYRLPVLLDPDFTLTEGYRITGLPTHYFIGRNGMIRDLAIGPLKPTGMRARLARITAP